MPKGDPLPLGTPGAQGSQEEFQGETHGGKHTGITIFNEEEPRSIYNLVPSEMQRAMKVVNPNVWNWSFKNLEKRAKPDPRLAQLRVAFWQEYNETQDKWRKGISITRVTNGICSRPYFYDEVMKDQYKLAYLLYPTTDYIASMMEMQDLAMREMRKILLLPNGGKKGHNMTVIKEKIKIFALLDNRIRGAVPKKIHRDETHTHAHAHINLSHQQAPQSIGDIEKEIKRIERTVVEATKTPREKVPDSPGAQPLEAQMPEEDPGKGDPF